MRAFIIRPFGKKLDGKDQEIDFDEVARVLISPALDAIGAEGRETLDIIKSGNIRTDMFRRLLTADLVVADLSIHNANVFYELGIRHALRNHGTLMLRCSADAFPFDLQTDRYFTYDRKDPAASLQKLTETLQAITAEIAKDYTAKDSPVFASLPNLEEPDPSLFNPIPQDFGEEVTRAAANNQPGDLALMSYEVKGFEWETRAWRTVGTAQFHINALMGAKETWEHVRRLEPQDLEANIWLGTIYERLGDLGRSIEALNRALNNKAIRQNERAEAYSLLARNFKTRWRQHWESKPPADRAAEALRSPHLQESFENYERAFDEYLNHFYSGLNALAMLKIMIELATALPEVWAENFASDKKATQALEDHAEHAEKLVAAVELSLKALSNRLEREGKKDIWGEISVADLMCITTNAPPRVAAAYRKALADAPGFNLKSIRQQLAIYRDLGILTGNLAEVFKVVGEPPALPDPGAEQAAAPDRKRVLLFAGHMIDAPDRENPRFPADREQLARDKIEEAIVQEMNNGAGVSCGYAGAASGGDILFLEICAKLGIPTRLYLAIPPKKYVNSSVKAGPNWVQRFWDIHNRHEKAQQLRVLSDVEDVKNDKEYLPAWLRSKDDYSIWQRNNLWMLFNALTEACDEKAGDPNLTLIALWDGQGGDGPGGTGDLVDKVQHVGAQHKIINTKDLFGL
jgi:tetratricopeptide (TPR) repeat protein